MINSSRSTDRRDRTIKSRDDRGFKAPLSRPDSKAKPLKEVTALVRGSRSLIKSEPVENLADLASCERVLLKGFQDVARALARIREAQLYKEAGYETFGDYCVARVGISRQRGDQFASAHFTIKSLPKRLATIVGNEAKARAISTVSENKRAEVLTRLVESGEPITAVAIRNEIRPEELKPRKKKPKVIDVTPEPNSGVDANPDMTHSMDSYREKHCPTCTCGE